MTARAIHTALSEEDLEKLAAADPTIKPLLEEYRTRRAKGEKLFIITDRQGKPKLSFSHL